MSSLAEGLETNAGTLCKLLNEAAKGGHLSLYYKAGVQWQNWRSLREVITGRGINRKIRRAFGVLASRCPPTGVRASPAIPQPGCWAAGGVESSFCCAADASRGGTAASAFIPLLGVIGRLALWRPAPKRGKGDSTAGSGNALAAGLPGEGSRAAPGG